MCKLRASHIIEARGVAAGAVVTEREKKTVSTTAGKCIERVFVASLPVAINAVPRASPSGISVATPAAEKRIGFNSRRIYQMGDGLVHNPMDHHLTFGYQRAFTNPPIFRGGQS